MFQNTRKFSEVFKEQVSNVGVGKAVAWNVYVTANKPLRWLSLKLDSRRDKKVCGTPMVAGKFTAYRESKGATNSVPTPYGALHEVLGEEIFTAQDSIVDVGCGHGRVLAYLVDSGFDGRITGIELDPEVAAFAKRWAMRYPNVRVIDGDAFEQDLGAYTVFYFWRPMLSDVFRKFIVKLEQEVKGTVRMYYLTDFDTAEFLRNRPGWSEVWTKTVYRHRGLPVFNAPQNCSAWTFTPKNR